MSNNFTIFHADHNIGEEQMQYIQATLGDLPDGFFIQQVELPPHLGTVPNGLYGPCCGDEPVEEAVVFYSSRGLDRAWEDRMVNRPARPVDFVQVIGIREGAEFKIFTCYGGPLAPQHPDDPSNQNPDASRAFWATHALAAG